MGKASMWENRETDVVEYAQTIIDQYALSIQRVVNRKAKKTKTPWDEGKIWFFAGVICSAALFLMLFLKFY